MSSLINKKNQQVLAQNVITARRFFSRVKGLMGKRDFPASTAFWIIPCTGGIHTLFMQFPLDVIFVDPYLRITAVFKNIAPWKTVHPGLFSKTYSVFELKSPALRQNELRTGDQLYVGNIGGSTTKSKLQTGDQLYVGD
ncbi:MAG: DUF192 domain-containing protein [Oligoflexia bacterium]|nr:DUF192 domain-containing protein [Bdellovibrionales bacterium]MYE07163.1 DUF192 domain-containing protein [Oligoflexia bacterium]